MKKALIGAILCTSTDAPDWLVWTLFDIGAICDFYLVKNAASQGFKTLTFALIFVLLIIAVLIVFFAVEM